MTAETFDATKCTGCSTYTEDPDGEGRCPACAGTGGDFDCCVPARRGTSNTNARGSSEDRRRRRAWLVETYSADRWLRRDGLGQIDTVLGGSRVGEPSCRCYRCGRLLTVDTVTVDRIVPGVKGGTYRRTNIRPACGTCNSETGGALASRPKAVRRG